MKRTFLDQPVFGQYAPRTIETRASYGNPFKHEPAPASRFAEGVAIAFACFAVGLFIGFVAFYK